MATSASLLQQELGSALDLTLSLGGLFSLPRNPCSQINRNNEDAVPALDLPSSHASHPHSPTLPVDRMKLTQHHTHLDAVKRRSDLHSQDINQPKRSRAPSDQDQSTSFCSSSGTSSKANYSKSTGNPDEKSSFQSDKNMRGYIDLHVIPSNGSHHMLSDMKKATVTHRKCTLRRPNRLETPLSSAVSCSHSPTVTCTSCSHMQTSPSNTQSSYNPTQKIPLSCRLSTFNILPPSLPSSDATTLETGSTGIINHMLPTKRKSSIEDELEAGGICLNNSAEWENEDNPDEESMATRKKVTVLEAPWSRSGSNSDMIGTMVDPLAAKSSTSSMMCMHPSAMVPVQGPFSVPIQWGFTIPYAMHCASHMVPPHTSFPWPVPINVPDSAHSLQPRVLAASCNEGKLQDNQETSSERDALTTSPSSKDKELQDVSQIAELPPATVHRAMPRIASEVCTSPTSLRPSCSTSPTANCSSDVCTSPWQPLTSATSPVTNYSSDSHKQVDPAKEDSRMNASNSSSTPEGCLKYVPCPQKSNDARPVGNKLCGQSQHSIPSGRKPTKTVRFCCDEREFVKSICSDNQMHKSSSSLTSRSGRVCKSADHAGKSFKIQLVKKLQSLGRQNGGIWNKTTEECGQEEESGNSRITSETSSDEDELGLVKVEGGAGKLEEKTSAASLPRVSTTSAGPNGKTIHGVMYITKSKQACLICSCHGTHMSPSEFVQHSGSMDLRNPERSIVVTGF